MARFSAPGAGLSCLLVALTLIGRAPAVSADGPEARVVRVIALGDSITKRVRPGVRPEETFASLAESALRTDGINAEVVNLGIGGERTDQALKRLDAVGELRPRVVTVMYGTNFRS
jgi:lysophospholipase L1-like esterase